MHHGHPSVLTSTLGRELDEHDASIDGVVGAGDESSVNESADDASPATIPRFVGAVGRQCASIVVPGSPISSGVG